MSAIAEMKGGISLRIMIVDDEQPSLDELEYLLQQQEDVVIAGTYRNPCEALASAQEHMPDAIFIDLMMPQMDGIELAEKIRQFDSAVRLVFVTAHARKLAVKKDGEAFEFILKPVAAVKLEQVLERLRQSLH